MSDLPERREAVFPVVIRNHRPLRWPAIVMRLSLLCAGISCLLALVASSYGIPPNVLVLLAVPACVGTIVAVVFAVAIMANRPVEKILLGPWLEIWPNKSRYKLGDVRQVEFVSNPEDDYAELNLTPPLREVRIGLRRGIGRRLLNLVVSSKDAAQLSAWAARNEIQLIGADRLAS